MLFTVTTHGSVCSPSFDAQGSCARGVIAVMGELMFARLLSSTYVAPLVALVKETSIVKRALAALRRSMATQEDEYQDEAVAEVNVDAIEGTLVA